jgi:hypothetical protein
LNARKQREKDENVERPWPAWRASDRCGSPYYDDDGAGSGAAVAIVVFPSDADDPAADDFFRFI